MVRVCEFLGLRVLACAGVRSGGMWELGLRGCGLYGVGSALVYGHGLRVR